MYSYLKLLGDWKRTIDSEVNHLTFMMMMMMMMIISILPYFCV